MSIFLQENWKTKKKKELNCNVTSFLSIFVFDNIQNENGGRWFFFFYLFNVCVCKYSSCGKSNGKFVEISLISFFISFGMAA